MKTIHEPSVERRARGDANAPIIRICIALASLLYHHL